MLDTLRECRAKDMEVFLECFDFRSHEIVRFVSEVQVWCFREIGSDDRDQLHQLRRKSLVRNQAVQIAFQYVLFGRLRVMLSELCCNWGV